MRLCSGHNLTLRMAVKRTPENKYYHIDKDGFMEGSYAELLYDRLFLDKMDYIKKNYPNCCKFLESPLEGKYIEENDTFTGAFGMVADGKAEFFLRPMEYLINSKYIEYTQPFLSANYFSSQFIDKKLDYNHDQSLIELFDYLIPSVSLLLFFLFGFIFHFASSKLIMWLKKKYFGQSGHSNLQAKILAFFLMIFIFYIDQFFNGNLNTSNVIVDTSEILNTKEKILQSKKEVCFLENNLELDYFKKAPKNSLVWKIWQKRNKGDLCYLLKDGFENSIPSVMKRGPTQIFVLVNDFLIVIGMPLSFIKGFFKLDVYLGEEIIYESLRGFIIGKFISKEIRMHLKNFVDSFTTFGFSISWLRNLPNLSEVPLAKTDYKEGEYMTYTSLKDYIDDYTKVVPLSFEKFDWIFKIYFSFLFLIFLCFLIHCILVRVFHSKHFQFLLRKFKSSQRHL